MRILGIGDFHDLGSMYLRLQAEGHAVRVHVTDPQAHDIMEGMVERIADWREHLDWIRDVGHEGLIVCETAHHGCLQDELRRDGFRVVGGCAYGDRLECDRAFGQHILADVGLPTVPSFAFCDVDTALAHLRRHPRRWVLKFDDTSEIICSTYVGNATDGSDVAAVLAARARQRPVSGILLTERVEGVEVGVGAFFNGERFLLPACLDWEHKTFFPGDLGELTGEMGTVVTYCGAETIFERTLARVAPQLRAGGYVGYINLNLIANADGLWPLEFTCRFGYPGFAILSALQVTLWGELLQRVADPSSTTFATDPGYAVGVVVTVPPFPYPDGYERLGKGLPIILDHLHASDHQHVHFAEVALRQGQLVCAGQIGYVMAVTGVGADVEQARASAYARVSRVIIPRMRYRTDIGDRLVAQGRAELHQWGLLEH